jgi:hypothetical protein
MISSLKVREQWLVTYVVDEQDGGDGEDKVDDTDDTSSQETSGSFSKTDLSLHFVSSFSNV